MAPHHSSGKVTAPHFHLASQPRTGESANSHGARRGPYLARCALATQPIRTLLAEAHPSHAAHLRLSQFAPCSPRPIPRTLRTCDSANSHPASRGPKHGPCRRFGGALRATEPPKPQFTTLFKRLKPSTRPLCLSPSSKPLAPRAVSSWGTSASKAPSHHAPIAPQTVSSRRRPPPPLTKGNGSPMTLPRQFPRAAPRTNRKPKGAVSDDTSLSIRAQRRAPIASQRERVSDDASPVTLPPPAPRLDRKPPPPVMV
jgi:hypothetical protein